MPRHGGGSARRIAGWPRPACPPKMTTKDTMMHLAELEPREKIEALDRLIRPLAMACVVGTGITLGFCVWRIQATQRFLDDLKAYIMERDEGWQAYVVQSRTLARETNGFVKQVEDHLTRQDADYRAIHQHMEEHEKFMRKQP